MGTDGLWIYSLSPNNATNDSSFSNSSQEYDDDVMFNSFLVSGFLCIFVMGVFGNSIVILLTFRPTCNVSVNTINTYIVNVAFSDLLYIFGCLFFTLTNYNKKGWMFGDIGCRLILGQDVLTMHVSTFILTIMSVERYIAVVHPMISLRYRSVTVARRVSAVIWLTGVMLTLPMVINMAQIKIDGRDKYSCKWTLDTKSSLPNYMMAVFLITFLIPSVVTATVYVLLLCHFINLVSPTHSANRRIKRSKRKVAQIIFVIVFVFWLCYIPFWSYQLIILHDETFDPNNIMGLATLVLSYLNSCVNPFLYTLLPRRYNMWRKFCSSRSRRTYTPVHVQLAAAKKPAHHASV
ncbi:urotensin-2 receptor-like [Diadema antillarum]|uniref:urotensin-2 receptor-like n=1 Tax=Diadema antillarum TaxID=105358 RepID=UPI003A8C7621